MNIQQRAKVYLLSDGNWEEICIGYVQIVHADGATFIRAIAEIQIKQCKNLVTYCHMNENKEDWCMNLKVNPDIKYEQHGENIIQWEQAEVKGEIAISFIDSKYASEIWNQLSSSKRHFRYDDLESTYPIIPSHQNLEAVQLQISDNPDLIIQKIITDGHHTFLEAIIKIFDDAESQLHYNVLEQLHYLIRSLIYLKNEQVLKCLLGDRFYMTFFGIMEYHSENKGPQRVSYREFLKAESKFHQITELDEKIMEKIHFNYRLSYLKESVMAYYLYIEDPIYIQFNQFINQNNQHILESLLLHHKGQFEKFLQGFMMNYEQNCKFINEFFLSFKQFLQIQSLNEAFVDSIQQTNLLGLLYKKILEIDQQQISFTTMQLTMMIANSNSQYLQEFLKLNSDLFWKSLEKLLFSNQISVQNMIIEIIYLISQNQTLIGQSIEWLKSCLQQPLSSQATFALQEIVQHICQQQKQFTPDLIILSNSLLNILCQQYKSPKFDKFMLIPALKHFKFICTTNVPMIVKPYCDSFVQIAVNKRIDGILEGQIRDILKFIKNDVGISQHLVLIIKSLNLQEHSLFVNLVKEYSYVQLEDNNNKVIMNLEEQRYYEQEDSEDQEEQHPQQITAQLERVEVQLDFSKIVRKREQDDDEEDETHVRQAKPSGIIFGDNCFKRIKMDNEDD